MALPETAYVKNLTDQDMVIHWDSVEDRLDAGKTKLTELHLANHYAKTYPQHTNPETGVVSPRVQVTRNEGGVEYLAKAIEVPVYSFQDGDVTRTFETQAAMQAAMREKIMQELAHSGNVPAPPVRGPDPATYGGTTDPQRRGPGRPPNPR